MNALITLGGGEAVTMTSLELVEFINNQRKEGEAELRHDHFMAKVPLVLGEGDAPNFRGIYLDAYKREKPCYKFPKRESCLMAMSYSYDLQAKVFDRMTALEQKTTIDPMKVLSDPAAMRGLLLTYTEKVLTLESKVEELTPKAEALDRMSLADGEVCLQTAGKLLQQPPNKFIAWLRSLNTWIFKRQGSSRNSAYTDKINAGYLNVRTVTTIMPDGSERVTEQVVVTPKGLAKLAQMLGVAGVQNNHQEGMTT